MPSRFEKLVAMLQMYTHYIDIIKTPVVTVNICISYGCLFDHMNYKSRFGFLFDPSPPQIILGKRLSTSSPRKEFSKFHTVQN